MTRCGRTSPGSIRSGARRPRPRRPTCRRRRSAGQWGQTLDAGQGLHEVEDAERRRQEGEPVGPASTSCLEPGLGGGPPHSALHGLELRPPERVDRHGGVAGELVGHDVDDDGLFVGSEAAHGHPVDVGGLPPALPGARRRDPERLDHRAAHRARALRAITALGQRHGDVIEGAGATGCQRPDREVDEVGVCAVVHASPCAASW